MRPFKTFWRGIALLLPTIATIVVISFVFNLIVHTVGDPINHFITFSLASTGWGHEYLVNHYHWAKDADGIFTGDFPQWIGVTLALIVVFVLGSVVSSYIGKKIWLAGEKVWSRFPIISKIYPYAKQITEFLFSDKALAATKVVAIEYPCKGTWALGFLTNPESKEFSGVSDEPMACVFVPHCPTPMTGYVVFLPAKNVIYLDLTMNDAMLIIISGGVLTSAQNQKAER